LESDDFAAVRLERTQFMIQHLQHRDCRIFVGIVQALNQPHLTVSQVSLVAKLVHGDSPK
jgi:hypothetical protein